MTSSLPVVAVVGGGFAGTALALRLQGAARVLLFEPGAPGPGLAYGTASPEHLLNVPAGGMSLWPERPGDFAEWLARQADAPAAPEGGGPIFAPRPFYGRYLREAWQAAAGAPGGTLTHLPRRVVAVEPAAGGGFHLRDEAGGRHMARQVVLALGGFAGGPGAPPRLIGHPWEAGALEGLAPGETVLLVGTGLTMADMVLSLRRRGHHGKVVAVSRHGWLPLPHVPGPLPPPWTVELPEGGMPGPLALLRLLRAEAAKAEAAGVPWQAVPDGIRPHVRAIWQSWGVEERGRFLRHAASLWNLHRHRLAPEVFASLAEERGQGGLEVLAGRLDSWQPEREGAEAILRLRGGGLRALRCGRILLCTGPSGSQAWAANPPVPMMVERGMLRPDGLGLSVSPAGAALDGEGREVPGLYVLGPLGRGTLWEITAVPEIRAQAGRLAEMILAS